MLNATPGLAFNNGTEFDFDSSPNKIYGYKMVFMEMTLAVFGIVFNLVVLISVREKESLLDSTINVVLANLCFANLISAVFVKSIAVIYNGYAVAATLWEVELAFCTIHTVTFRATWAVFPYSLVVICWQGMILRASFIFRARGRNLKKGESSKAMIKQGYKAAAVAVIESRSPSVDYNTDQMALREIQIAKQSSIEVSHAAEAAAEDNFLMEEGMDTAAAAWKAAMDEEDAAEEEMEGGEMTSRNKIALGFIWVISVAYALMSKEILSKEKNVPCSVRQELGDNVNMFSLIVAIAVPMVIGPILCPVVHFILTCYNVCCENCLSQSGSSSIEETSNAQHKCSACLIDFGIIFCFTVVFLLTYPMHMYITETYLATVETHFAFMAFKYCFGCLHLVLLPLTILCIRRDIRLAAVDVYFKRLNKDNASEPPKFGKPQPNPK